MKPFLTTITPKTPNAPRLRSLLLTGVALLAGCGYGLQGSGSRLPKDVKSVAIAEVVNDTTEAGLDKRFSEELRSRFERYGVVTVVDEPRLADALLSVRIRSVDTRTRNVSSGTDVAVDLDLTMTLAAELKRKNGQILWRDTNYRITEPFAQQQDVVVQSSSSFVEGNLGSANLANLSTEQLSRGQKESAIANILEEAARELYEDAVAADF